jgi:hypothetical protein
VSDKDGSVALSDVLGVSSEGVFGGRAPEGQAPWDAFVIAKAPGLDGDEVLFWALPDGDLLVAENGAENVSALADAIEKKIQRPYKALAGRQDSEHWAVAATRISAVARFEFSSGDTLELERDGATTTFTVDGTSSAEQAPPALQAIAESESSDFYVVAERIDGDLWDVRTT